MLLHLTVDKKFFFLLNFVHLELKSAPKCTVVNATHSVHITTTRYLSLLADVSRRRRLKW